MYIYIICTYIHIYMYVHINIYIYVCMYIYSQIELTQVSNFQFYVYTIFTLAFYKILMSSIINIPLFYDIF